jgi:SNF2 family DNA or RNA helicase
MQEIKDNAKMIKLKNGAGAMINTSVIKIQSLLAKHKVKWTLEYIKAHPEEKAIVISNYNKDVLDFLGEVLEVDVYKGATKNKQDMVDSFNNGEFNVFLGQRKVAETGLNVQTATTLIVNDMHWSLASMIQIMGRIKRRGQKNHFKILMPVVEGTLDQQILKRLESKHNEYRSFHGIEDGIQLGEIRSRLDRDTGLEIRHELIRELLS